MLATVTLPEGEEGPTGKDGAQPIITHGATRLSYFVCGRGPHILGKGASPLTGV